MSSKLVLARVTESRPQTQHDKAGLTTAELPPKESCGNYHSSLAQTHLDLTPMQLINEDILF